MPDLLTVRIVAVSLAVLAGCGLFAVAWLVYSGVDTASIAIVSTLTGPAVGALCSLLASTRGGPQEGVTTTTTETTK